MLWYFDGMEEDEFDYQEQAQYELEQADREHEDYKLGMGRYE